MMRPQEMIDFADFPVSVVNLALTLLDAMEIGSTLKALSSALLIIPSPSSC